MKQINYHYHKKIDNSVTPKSSLRNDIVEWVYKTHLVEYYVTLNLGKPMTHPDAQDYCQEIYLQLCEIPQEKWDEIWEFGFVALKGYVCSIIKNNNCSETSVAYRNIRKSVKDWLSYDSFDELSTPEELLEIDRKIQRENYENTEY